MKPQDPGDLCYLYRLSMLPDAPVAWCACLPSEAIVRSIGWPYSKR